MNKTRTLGILNNIMLQAQEDGNLDVKSINKVMSKLGKEKVWSMNVDEVCDYLDENYDITIKTNTIMLRKENE